jgi:tripartite-type tricarboxylate transporter receptor subunit TctC
VVVDNPPGAGANIAAELVSKAPPGEKYAKVVKAIGLGIE